MISARQLQATAYSHKPTTYEHEIMIVTYMLSSNNLSLHVLGTCRYLAWHQRSIPNTQVCIEAEDASAIGLVYYSPHAHS